MHDQAVTFFRGLQDRICAALQRADGGASFREDTWQRPGGGGGRSRVIENGNVFEKGGVNFSEVYGELSPEFAKQLPGDGPTFTAAGVSLVVHPRSPLVPTVHANFRYLTHGAKRWFGGGGDLTPYYPLKADVIHFHRTWKQVCDAHPGVADYAKMKKDCDEYFHLKHRGEARGVGGIFFDYMDATAATFAFVTAAADAFIDSYVPIVERRKGAAYTPEQRVFQEYRRGRYVEFNLVYDRGTVFGLKTDGRTESILMSLPPVVRYIYDYRPAPGTPEAELTEYWLKPRDWAAMEG
ncbi:MAG: oxygen-dependent coproporphyrinogen oxidase [Gemmata sp.]